MKPTTASMSNPEPLFLELEDTQWPLTCTDHTREIVRAIVLDEDDFLYFVGIDRDDDFGRAVYIETAGGGVEPGEDLHTAICRELQEELGVEVQVLCKLGEVRDYYNLIHRRNINHYVLCKITAFGEPHRTKDEVERFHLSTRKMTCEEALQTYEACANTRLGKLVANRELPILRHTKEILKG